MLKPFRNALMGLLALSLLPSIARADVKLPAIFSSHGVLQREMPIPVWGWADPGEEVKVQLGDQAAVSAKAGADGKWQVKLAATPAGGPFALKVSGKNEVVLDDILIGEVWLCSGQSNMEMAVGGSQNFEQEKADAANFPMIRHFKVAKDPQPLPVDDCKGAWAVCTPETVGGFTAAGYFMAKTLEPELKVPIGLLNSSWGGTKIEPWVAPEGFAMVPSLSDVHQRVLQAMPSNPAYKELFTSYLSDWAAWAKTAKEAQAEDGFVAAAPAFPGGLRPLTESSSPQQQPTTLYNGMLYPVIPYAIRGAIWYQGESNHHDGMLYADKTKAMVQGWRQLWGEGDFPFFAVQIAPYRYGTEPGYYMPEFWEAQAAAARELPNSGLAITTDVAMLDNIHPVNKQAVGRRLALLALAKVYGQQNLVYTGPTFKELKLEGDNLRVVFDNVGGGLVARDGKPLDWFEIIGPETAWLKANAKVDGNSVVLSLPECKSPQAVRFAWDKLAEPNLMNQEGLPAWPFRAGEVPTHDNLVLKVDEAKDYELVYDLDLSKLGREIKYEVDNSARITKPFDRIAYFLELQKPDGPEQYAYVSMDAFTDDVTKIGVPAVAAKAKFQQLVNNLTVLSNVEGIQTGTGLKGNIEFWPDNYGGGNNSKVPNASNSLFDWGDSPSAPTDGYGCMQVHNYAAKQVIFVINNWKAGQGGELGIGNNTGGPNPDYTFMHNNSQYKTKRLRVLVHVKQ